MDHRWFRRQFLMSRLPCELSGWQYMQVDDYHLYVHPDLELCNSIHANRQLILIGYLFDADDPAATNQQILDTLTACTDEQFYDSLDELGGQFVIVLKSNDRFILLHDAGGQQEVYYDVTFSAFGSQPKLLQRTILLEPFTDTIESEFYRSEKFLESKIFVGGSTHLKNVMHLMPNHEIDIRNKTVRRYFPSQPIATVDTHAAVSIAIKKLRGFIDAASRRYDIRIGVTAGYDSRILFLASLGLPCTYYTGKSKNKDNAIDIRIAKQLVEAHNMNHHVPDYTAQADQQSREVMDVSIDFPRYKPVGRNSSNRMVITGNISEVARSYFGVFDFQKGTELARACGLANLTFAEETFDAWLKANRTHFDSLGYDYRDMFYWEERIGNWAAKGKTESALNTIVYSPYCCRKLLVALLGTKPTDRDKHYNVLYDEMIRTLSPQAARIPINPNRKTNVIKAMKRFGVYGLYRRIGMKMKLLKS